MNGMRGLGSSLARRFSKLYSKDHEWIKQVGSSNVYEIGISDYAQSKLGGIIYLSYPDKNKSYKLHEVLGEIESPKAVSSIYSPASVKIVDTNTALDSDLSKINTHAESTWLFKAELKDSKELAGLMSESDYKKFIKDL